MNRLSNLRVTNPVLSNLATGYQNSEFVAEHLFPMATVDSEAGTIPTFGKENFLIHNTLRALRAKSNRIQPPSNGDVKVVLDEHDLEYPIDYRETAESAYPLQAHATSTVMEGLQLRREKFCADLAQKSGSYAGSNKITLAASAKFTHDDSDPEGVVDDGKSAIRLKIAKTPNTMVMGYETFRALRRNKQLRNILSTTRSRLVRLSDLKEIFEIENIYVGASSYLAKIGGAQADIWGDNIVMAYVPTKVAGMDRSTLEPSYGYTLRKPGYPQVDTRGEDGKIEIIRSTDIYRPYLLGADAGYLITDTNG